MATKMKWKLLKTVSEEIRICGIYRITFNPAILDKRKHVISINTLIIGKVKSLDTAKRICKLLRDG